MPTKKRDDHGRFIGTVPDRKVKDPKKVTKPDPLKKKSGSRKPVVPPWAKK